MLCRVESNYTTSTLTIATASKGETNQNEIFAVIISRTKGMVRLNRQTGNRCMWACRMPSAQYHSLCYHARFVKICKYFLLDLIGINVEFGVFAYTNLRTLINLCKWLTFNRPKNLSTIHCFKYAYISAAYHGNVNSPDEALSSVFKKISISILTRNKKSS